MVPVEEEDVTLDARHRRLVAGKDRHGFHSDAETVDPGGSHKDAVLPHAEQRISDLGFRPLVTSEQMLDETRPAHNAVNGRRINSQG